jgi:hypothetical protein
MFLASMVSGALFIFPLYRYTPLNSAELFMGAKNYFPLLIFAALCTVLPMITIFMFGNRKRQKSMIWLSVLCCAAFIGLMLMHISELRNAVPAPAGDSYMVPGALLPVLSIICLFLAFSGIRKDEKLIRSVDRLR